MRRLAAIALVALTGGCVAEPDRVHPVFAPLDSDGHYLRDPEGRIVILRGINARVAGVFDVSFADGRTPLEDIPPLGDDDCARMRKLGFNVVRLPISWSGVEPMPGVFDHAYLDRVDAAVACASHAGLWTIVDFHQDAYSKEIGEDGAPRWAIVPAPEGLLGGPLTDLDVRRQSRQVLAAFAAFFAEGDPNGLQAAFIAMAEHVARRYADDPGVLGFELYNEPVAAPTPLAAFHIAAATALRAAAPRKLVFFEPPAVRNFTDFEPLAAAPFPVAGAVYAPHAYTFVFANQDAALATMSKGDLRIGIANAVAEAAAWQTPLFLGEFGIGPYATRADDWMRFEAELHDEVLAGDAFWLWKEHSQGNWGVFDLAGEAWTERPQVVAWVARLRPERIAGEVVRVATTGGALELESHGGDAPHIIYVPPAASATYQVSCDGHALHLPRDPATGTIAAPCDGTLRVTP